MSQLRLETQAVCLTMHALAIQSTSRAQQGVTNFSPVWKY